MSAIDINQVLAVRLSDLNTIEQHITQLQNSLAENVRIRAHIQGAIKQLQDIGAVLPDDMPPVVAEEQTPDPVAT